jgi:hypothetical protein
MKQRETRGRPVITMSGCGGKCSARWESCMLQKKIDSRKHGRKQAHRIRTSPVVRCTHERGRETVPVQYSKTISILRVRACPETS